MTLLHSIRRQMIGIVFRRNAFRHATAYVGIVRGLEDYEQTKTHPCDGRRSRVFLRSSISGWQWPISRILTTLLLLTGYAYVPYSS